MSNYSKYTRKFLKKVIRKIAFRGKISIKEARGFLDHKPNFNNIKHVLRCCCIVPLTDDYFNQGSADVYFIKIGERVYVLEMNPVFTFTETYPAPLADFFKLWVSHMPGDVKRPEPEKLPFTVTDHRSNVSVTVNLTISRYMEISKQRKLL